MWRTIETRERVRSAAADVKGSGANVVDQVETPLSLVSPGLDQGQVDKLTEAGARDRRIRCQARIDRYCWAITPRSGNIYNR